MNETITYAADDVDFCTEDLFRNPFADIPVFIDVKHVEDINEVQTWPYFYGRNHKHGERDWKDE